ncbi:lytic transglycosylase domain-containing protein [Nesterenkonia marinintestina]|uniref:lytic transglycosylase domain-containing protein n=1 Tax=Nesterenkonia marinintestina TaxID=2979865 RepID=UPI0028FC2691|nr:lytic transglycosylase domain-containing protein [Nesterenkonia sp. GX14115]
MGRIASTAGKGIMLKVLGGSIGVLAPFVIAAALALGLLAVMATAWSPEQTGGQGRACAAPEGSSAQNGEMPEELQVPQEYEDALHGAANESGLPVSLLAAQVYYESNWDPDAESEANAQGIAQFTPATWAQWGEGGDVWDPQDAIAAQGRYMGYFVETFEDDAQDDEHLMELAIAGYHAGEGNVAAANYQVSEVGPRTNQYVLNIMAATEGDSVAYCDDAGSSVPAGDAVEASAELAWDEEVTLPRSTAAEHGREESKDEYVDAVQIHGMQPSHAFYTDCGLFVSTVMHTAELDTEFPARGTSIQMDYLTSSEKYDTFTPQSEGELEPGDILIITGEGIGHIYLYTGQRHDGDDGRAQGASLGERPPSGHKFFLSDFRGDYTAARLTDPDTSPEDENTHDTDQGNQDDQEDS